jgi:hypothetical protein
MGENAICRALPKLKQALVTLTLTLYQPTSHVAIRNDARHFVSNENRMPVIATRSASEKLTTVARPRMRDVINYSDGAMDDDDDREIRVAPRELAL